MNSYKNIALAIAVSAAAIAAPAFAEDEVAPPAPAPAKVAKLGIGVTAGSFGIGPEVSYALNRHLDVRANATFFSISHNISGAVGYRATANLGSGGVMVDYHLGGGGFRISAGVRIDGNKASLVGVTANGATLNGNTYSAPQIGELRANARFATVAPTVTFGYAGTLKHGLKFGIEAGAMFSGSAHLKPITASGGGVADADLEAERQRIQDKVNPYKVYPILQFSVGYRF